LRYRSDALPGLTQPFAQVLVNGTDIGEMSLGASVGEMAESTIFIPGELIQSSLTSIDVTWEGFVTGFRWWAVDAGEGVLILPEFDPEAEEEVVESPQTGLGPPDGAIAFDQFGVDNGAPADLRSPDTIKHGRWWIDIDSTATFGILNERLVESSLDPAQNHRMVINARSPDVIVGADVQWTGSAAGLVTRHDGEVNGTTGSWPGTAERADRSCWVAL